MKQDCGKNQHIIPFIEQQAVFRYSEQNSQCEGMHSDIYHNETSTNEVVQTLPFGPVKRRSTANKKERKRTQSINTAFTDLRDRIPNVPSDTKLSKVSSIFVLRSKFTTGKNRYSEYKT